MKTTAEVWSTFKTLTNDIRCKDWDDVCIFENHIKFILKWYIHESDIDKYWTSDSKYFLINSNFKSKGGKYIYILVETRWENFEYVSAVDIFDEVELKKYKRNIFLDNFKLPPPPTMMKIEPGDFNEQGDILHEYNKTKAGRYKGGTIGHFLVDGLDNFPEIYKVNKWNELFENIQFSEIKMKEVFDNSMELYISTSDYEVSERDESSDPIKVNKVLSDMELTLNQEYDFSFNKWISHDLKGVFYLDKFANKNMAIPLYHGESPFAVLILRFYTETKGCKTLLHTAPQTLLKLYEIRRNISIYSEPLPIWLTK